MLKRSSFLSVAMLLGTIIVPGARGQEQQIWKNPGPKTRHSRSEKSEAEV
jgi:hypothetical protein